MLHYSYSTIKQAELIKLILS